MKVLKRSRLKVRKRQKRKTITRGKSTQSKFHRHKSKSMVHTIALSQWSGLLPCNRRLERMPSNRIKLMIELLLSYAWLCHAKISSVAANGNSVGSSHIHPNIELISQSLVLFSFISPWILQSSGISFTKIRLFVDPSARLGAFVWTNQNEKCLTPVMCLWACVLLQDTSDVLALSQ